MSRECCNLDQKAGIPLFLHYRIVILCNSFYLINVCWFFLVLAYKRSKIMLP